MHITVFGATGQVGKRIVQQALNNGFKVTAFGRNVESLIDQDNLNENLTAQKGYLFDEKDVAKAIEKADVIFSVLGGASDGSDKTRSLGIKQIITQMQKKGKRRIIALGGMGVLNAEDNTLLLHADDYPKEYLAVGMEHLKAFELLLESNLDWSFFCPADIHDKDETGIYITSINYAPDPNHFRINAGDLAMAMLKAAINQEYIQQRVGISNY
ncbi:NAD(P)-dependent oxidoreductase [Sediminibacterium sp.]|uniref:NAD(P)-dependent oxidoreductase n=1 Tax=Sediminibacterium sp. TaxID=1917865 RepID=UPI003F6ECA06